MNFLKRIKYYIGIYLYMIKLRIKITLTYRANFLISFFTNIPIQIVEFLFIWVIFQNITDLQGWSFYEMTLVYGFMIAAKGLADTFFDNFYEMPKDYIRNGKFDTVMVQPMNELFNLIARDCYMGAISGFFLGVAIIVVSLINLPIAIGLTEILLIIAFILMGGLMFGGIMLISTVPSFYIIDGLDVIWSVYMFYQLALYPIGIYGTFIKGLVTFIIPFAFVSYYPVAFLLGKAGGFMAMFTPIMLTLVWFVGIQLWKKGVHDYGSTGS